MLPLERGLQMSRKTEARIGYVAAMADKPISHAGYPDKENLVMDWRDVAVASAHGLSADSLRTCGFTVVSHKSEISAFDEDGVWKDRFALEIEELVKSVTGAREVFVPQRAASVRSVQLMGSQAPASFCHNDFTPGSAARHVAALVPERANELLAKRFAAYNLWRLIKPGPQDQPLALCDARSTNAADMIPSEARYTIKSEDHVFGEMACFRYNPAHRWFYYPDLTVDEILIWAGYDSDPEQASIVPHTAFVDKNCPVGAGPRTNIDCRCFAFFD